MTQILLLNTTIITAPENGASYRTARITAHGARQIMEFYAWTSYIGHEASAEAFSAISGHRVPTNRAQAEQAQGQVALCLKLRGRLPEGAILSKEQMDEIGYDFFLIARTDGDKGRQAEAWVNALHDDQMIDLPGQQATPATGTVRILPVSEAASVPRTSQYVMVGTGCPAGLNGGHCVRTVHADPAGPKAHIDPIDYAQPAFVLREGRDVYVLVGETPVTAPGADMGQWARYIADRITSLAAGELVFGGLPRKAAHVRWTANADDGQGGYYVAGVVVVDGFPQQMQSFQGEGEEEFSARAGGWAGRNGFEFGGDEPAEMFARYRATLGR